MQQQKTKPNPNKTGQTESRIEKDGSSLPRTDVTVAARGWGRNPDDIKPNLMVTQSQYLEISLGNVSHSFRKLEVYGIWKLTKKNVKSTHNFTPQI